MLLAVQHPFIVNLWGSFQDTTNLYMVMDFVPGGELFTLLRRSNVRLLSSAPLPFPSEPSHIALPGPCCEILRRRGGLGAPPPT